MRRTLQAAAVLSFHRGAMAFLASPPSAALASRAARSTAAAAASRFASSDCSSSSPGDGLRQARQGATQSALRSAGGAGAESDMDSDAQAAMKKLLAEDFGANVKIDPKRVAVLFDFDGTIGDTETPAMEVAYWELAPYFPGAASEDGGVCCRVRGWMGCGGCWPVSCWFLGGYDMYVWRFCFVCFSWCLVCGVCVLYVYSWNSACVACYLVYCSTNNSIYRTRAYITPQSACKLLVTCWHTRPSGMLQTFEFPLALVSGWGGGGTGVAAS